MNFQEFISNLIKSDDKERKLIFGDFLDFLYSNYKTLPKDYFESEPNGWGDLRKENISFYVASFHRLCNILGHFNKPKWFFDDKFILKDPYFAMNAKGMLKLVLLSESPKEFRIRNIYVTSNVLSRV